jgi:flagellar biosynthesis protein FlhB
MIHHLRSGLVGAAILILLKTVVGIVLTGGLVDFVEMYRQFDWWNWLSEFAQIFGVFALGALHSLLRVPLGFLVVGVCLMPVPWYAILLWQFDEPQSFVYWLLPLCNMIVASIPLVATLIARGVRSSASSR